MARAFRWRFCWQYRLLQPENEFRKRAEQTEFADRSRQTVAAKDQGALSAEIQSFHRAQRRSALSGFLQEAEVDVIFDQIQMVATNLTNSKKLSKTLVAELQIEGRPLRVG